ncbi:MAG: redoxin domain-containing protein [Planctomycetia bacterium]|nr:redoxin domain-containing protein [Planctomycetia bacterium]
MRDVRHSWVLLAVLWLAPSEVSADGIEIKGNIVDAEGRPAPGVEFGAQWFNPGGKLVPKQRWKPGADGGFQAELQWIHRPMALLAMDAAGKRGALRILEKDDLTVPIVLSLKLEPFAAVQGVLACPGLGPNIGDARVFVRAKPSDATVFALNVAGGAFAFSLPPGDYEILAELRNARPLCHAFRVESADRPVQLGRLVLEPTPVAQAWGGPPPPLGATGARGVPADFRLADLKGKWVVVVFWNARMDQATRVVLEQLKQLALERQADAGRFAVVTVYDPAAKTWDDYDRDVAPLKKGLWSGADLPFPVLLDSTGESWKAWGVEQEPLTALLDPDGNLVREGDYASLGPKLDETGAGK